MTERIDNIDYVQPTLASTREEFETLFLTGPTEFLCAEVCKQLLDVPAWAKIFGENINPYKRMDYSMRALPALRCYIDRFKKEAETWYINGQMVIDMILPASLRRPELEQIPDTLASALIQQFRRPTFFASVCQRVPGLNELGRTFDVDKSLAFAWDEAEVPLAQMILNFRMNLDEWDRYMESDGRTRDEPFSRPLLNLTRIVSVIEGLREDGEVEVTLSLDQDV